MQINLLCSVVIASVMAVNENDQKAEPNVQPLLSK